MDKTIINYIGKMKQKIVDFIKNKTFLSYCIIR